MALSIDLRKRVIAAVDAGMRITDASKSFQVGRKVIYSWLNLRKETNSIAPKSGYQKGHSHKIVDWEKFKEFVKDHQHLTSAKMIIEWEKITNVHMSESVILRALKKIGYTSKKNFWIHRSKHRKT
jgi:transposase